MTRIGLSCAPPHPERRPALPLPPSIGPGLPRRGTGPGQAGQGSQQGHQGLQLGLGPMWGQDVVSTEATFHVAREVLEPHNFMIFLRLLIQLPLVPSLV